MPPTEFTFFPSPTTHDNRRAFLIGSQNARIFFYRLSKTKRGNVA
jgi:hypothetical protein